MRVTIQSQKAHEANVLCLLVDALKLHENRMSTFDTMQPSRPKTNNLSWIIGKAEALHTVYENAMEAVGQSQQSTGDKRSKAT